MLEACLGMLETCWNIIHVAIHLFERVRCSGITVLTLFEWLLDHLTLSCIVLCRFPISKAEHDPWSSLNQGWNHHIHIQGSQSSTIDEWRCCGSIVLFHMPASFPQSNVTNACWMTLNFHQCVWNLPEHVLACLKHVFNLVWSWLWPVPREWVNHFEWAECKQGTAQLLSTVIANAQYGADMGRPGRADLLAEFEAVGREGKFISRKHAWSRLACAVSMLEHTWSSFVPHKHVKADRNTL